MKTNLFGKSNAVLLSDEGEFIAIISCGAKVDITDKVKRAIKEHYVVESVTFKVTEELTNQKSVKFTADIVTEDGDDEVRDFEIFITATY